jgi:hypothetical protein
VAVATAVVVVAVLGVTITSDVDARTRNRQEQGELTAARSTLSSTRHDLDTTRLATALTTQHRNALQASIESELGQLSTTNASLSSTDNAAYLQGLDINTLQTCLGGVQQAYQQISDNDKQQAGSDISAVSGPCESLDGQSSSGLVYPFDFPDPDVILAGNTYYAYATNSVAGNIQIIDSTDLVHWTFVGDALPNLPSWATPDATWAPGVAQIGGNYLLYYAATVAGPGGGEECISVASAGQPQGPFVDSSTAPLECQPSLGNAIDPSPFIDTNGNIYLEWKTGSNGTNAQIWSEQLTPAGNAFAPNTTPTLLLSADQPWEAGNVEAPDLVTSGGRYFLFYAGNSFDGSNYAEGVAQCTGPLGPCHDMSAQPILSSGGGVEGPGSADVFADASGQYRIAFDGYVPGAVGYPSSRDLYVRRIDLSGAVPTVDATG